MKSANLLKNNIVIYLAGFIFCIFFFFYYVNNVLAVCQADSINPRAEGLISSFSLDPSSKFGNPGAKCVLDSNAVFAPYNIYTYQDLKSIFFTQSKATKQTLSGSTIPANFTTDGIYVTNQTSPNITINSSPTGQGTQVFFVDGNLSIQNNLVYHTNDKNGGLVFVVWGNIDINTSVTQVDAVLISTGTICTANTAGSCLDGTVTTNQLRLNGSLISLNPSLPIKFVRNLGVTDNQNTPAELITQQAKYLVTLKDLFSQSLSFRSEDAVYPSPYPSVVYASPNPGSAQQDPIYNGLVAWWKMEEASGDIFDSLYHLSLIPSTSLTYQIPGKIGSSINFVSPGAYCPNTVCRNLTPNRATGFTYSAWVNPVSFGGSTNNIIMQKTSGNNPEFELGINSSGNIRVEMGNSNCNNDSGTGFNTNPGVPVIPKNTWSHIVVTVPSTTSGSVSLKVYVNGSLAFTTANKAYYCNNNGTFYVGKNFSVKVDELAIWQRELSPAEITQLYNGGGGFVYNYITPVTTVFNGIVSYYPMEETSGTLVADLMANNNGTSTSSTNFTTGKVGNARSFNGTGDYINLGNRTILDFGAGDFTYAAWIKNNGSTTNARIISQDTNLPNHRALVWENGVVSFWCRDASNNTIRATSGLVPNDGNFHSVVGVRRGNQGLIYLDNRSPIVVNGTGTVGSCDGGASTFIGARNTTTPGLYFKGTIDEVGIWNRALTAAEVLEYYNTQQPIVFTRQPYGSGNSDSSLRISFYTNICPFSYIVYFRKLGTIPYLIASPPSSGESKSCTSSTYQTSFNIGGLSDSTTYEYYVKAKNSAGVETTSAVNSGQTASKP